MINIDYELWNVFNDSDYTNVIHSVEYRILGLDCQRYLHIWQSQYFHTYQFHSFSIRTKTCTICSRLISQGLYEYLYIYIYVWANNMDQQLLLNGLTLNTFLPIQPFNIAFLKKTELYSRPIGIQ